MTRVIQMYQTMTQSEDFTLRKDLSVPRSSAYLFCKLWALPQPKRLDNLPRCICRGLWLCLVSEDPVLNRHLRHDGCC